MPLDAWLLNFAQRAIDLGREQKVQGPSISMSTFKSTPLFQLDLLTLNNAMVMFRNVFVLL